MKIISWNINGYRAITGQNAKKKFDTVSYDNKFFDYVSKENPDIICIQETKAEESQIDKDKLAPAGYQPFYHSCRKKKGYSGVACFTKVTPKEVIINIGEEHIDHEGRIIGLDFEDFMLFNVYFPNGTSGDHRVSYKLEFYDILFNYLNVFKKKGRKIIVCGDYNTAHKEIDLARPKENEETSGFLPEERVKLDEIVSAGWVDTFREFSKEPNKYTWWSQRGGARGRNVGWRIDYHFVTDNLMNQVANSYHQDQQQGSDHCPIILELK